MTRPLRSTTITAASSLLRSNPPLSDAPVLSALRWKPLVPFPLASPARFSRSSVWTWKELAGLANDPIGQETHPFARRRIDEGQPFGKMVGKLQEIAAPARSPVDWIRLHFKSDLAKDADRPWHMMGRRHQQPSLAALRRHQGLGKLGVFVRVARTPFHDQAVFGKAETFEHRHGEIGFLRRVT